MDDLRTVVQRLEASTQNLQNSVTSSANRVVKLNGTNHLKWKREMTMYFVDAGLWEIVSQAQSRT